MQLLGQIWYVDLFEILSGQKNLSYWRQALNSLGLLVYCTVLNSMREGFWFHWELVQLFYCNCAFYAAAYMDTASASWKTFMVDQLIWSGRGESVEWLQLCLCTDSSLSVMLLSLSMFALMHTFVKYSTVYSKGHTHLLFGYQLKLNYSMKSSILMFNLWMLALTHPNSHIFAPDVEVFRLCWFYYQLGVPF